MIKKPSVRRLFCYNFIRRVIEAVITGERVQNRIAFSRAIPHKARSFGSIVLLCARNDYATGAGRVLKTSACQFILFFKKPCIYKGFRTFPSCGISQFSRKVLAKIGVPTPPQFHTEGYRSGHNEAVLKTVWVHAHVGSNPTPSANFHKNMS